MIYLQKKVTVPYTPKQSFGNSLVVPLSTAAFSLPPTITVLGRHCLKYCVCFFCCRPCDIS